jgi:hypothetical protein
MGFFIHSLGLLQPEPIVPRYIFACPVVTIQAFTGAESPFRKGLSGRGWRDSEGFSKPTWNRDVDPSHAAAA